MWRQPRLILACASALLACGPRQRSSAVTPPRTSVVVSSIPAVILPAPVEASGESPRSSPCDCALDKSRRTLERGAQLARARASELGIALGSAGGPPELPEPAALVPDLPCWPNGTVAWAVTLKEVTLCPPAPGNTPAEGEQWNLTSDFHLSHVSADRCEGDHLYFSWTVESEDWEGDERFGHCAYHEHPFYTRVRPSLLFDFDADGDPEIWIGTDSKYTRPSSSLYTFKQGKVELYPLQPHAYADLKDVTADGRPDLTWSDGLAESIDCGDDPYTIHTPAFLAHSQPDGSFSDVSEEARRFARGWCPSSPAKLQTSADVVCARLWGDDRQALVTRIRAQRVPWDCALSTQSPVATVEYDAMLAGAKYEPPFRF